MAYSLRQLNRRGVPPLLSGIASPADWERKRRKIVRTWKTCLGELPERKPPDYEVVSQTELGDHSRLHIHYGTAGGDRVSAYLLVPHDRPAGGACPAVMALHPTIENGKDDIATAEGRANRRYGLELVQRGYVVLAPDTITAGERAAAPSEAYRTANFYAQYPHWTAIGKMLIDHQYGLDLLCAFPEADPNRIGAIGHSLGGYNSFFLAGLDDRIRAFVSSCGFCTFAGDPEPGRWGQRDWFSHMPRLSEDIAAGRVPFEFHELAALAAPIPAFYYSGQQDEIFPHWSAYSEGMAQLFELYGLLGRRDAFHYTLTNGGHDFPDAVRQMSYAFLDRHLGREAT